MTMWELSACVDGVNRANDTGDNLEPPTDEEFDKMIESYEQAHGTIH